jgi:transposase
MLVAEKFIRSVVSKYGRHTVYTDDGTCIFVYDYVIRRKKWISVGKRPVVTVTGSRRQTIVFGCLSLEDKQLFKQYDEFNSNTFVDYIKHVQKRFGKCIIFVDRATTPCSKITRQYLAQNKDTIRLEYLPVGSPEFNAVEECWRQLNFIYFPLIILCLLL